MPDRLVVGPIDNGQRTDRLPFVIDNDNFPVLINAYQWRGRVKRKRGTAPLGRLVFRLGSTDGSGNAVFTILPIPITVGISSFVIGSAVFYDPGGSSPVALLTNGPGTASLNRSTGVLTITGSNASTIVYYYPSLPVMGLEELLLDQTSYPGTIGFDTRYAYNLSTTYPYPINNVSFYKNPATGTYAGYVAKGTQTPLWWNGQDYQQFWTTNYQGALWATNGIQTNPVDLSKVGMQFKRIITVDNITTGPPSFADLTITDHGLVVGDFVFVNEVLTTTGINFQTGYVTVVVSANKVTVEFPNATIATNGTLGIAQYLTNRSDTTKDCLRWYDGDPTQGTGIGSVSTLGWVNFMPPLFSSNTPGVTIDDLPANQYYLVGARLILAFKDRLMFFGPIVQSSSATPAIAGPFYLEDTVIYSQNGTPYYTASFTGDPTLATTVYNPILVPVNQTATASAYFSNVTGFGGFVVAGVSQAIISVGGNQDALVVGFSGNLQTKIIYTGDDLSPFLFYITNSEMSSSSTFSTIVMDEGVITRGNRGYVITDQTRSQRIDLLNPDQVFQIKLTGHGADRFTAQRDFINEWIYFTYPSTNNTNVYPTQTFLYNYRDQSWAVFNETYTTYGQFNPVAGFTWLTLPLTWATWNSPWNSGDITALQPQVIAGNQQGFVVFRSDEDTIETDSLTIQNIVGQTITSPSHCLNMGDFVIINGCKGSIGTIVNGKIFQVINVTTDTFFVSSPPIITGSYQGGGTIQRMYRPFVQTRQFPPNWGYGRKTRIGSQQYLLSKTPDGEITVYIYLSQNVNNPYNAGSIVPTTSPTPENNSLIYSQVISTSPDFYINSSIRASLGSIGNGILTSFVFNYPSTFSYENEGLVPGSVYIQVGSVATFTDNGSGGFTATGTGTSAGSSVNYTTSIVTIAFTSAPTSQSTITNFQYYYEDIQNPTASQQQQIWHNMNTSLLGDTLQLGFTISDDQMRDVSLSGIPTSGFSEVELHAFTMNLSPSSLLA